MIRMTLSEYLRKPKDYRGVWTTERWDLPDWEKEREKYMGKRTLMTNIDGATCLVVEGMSLEIIDDSDWKKPELEILHRARHRASLCRLPYPL